MPRYSTAFDERSSGLDCDDGRILTPPNENRKKLSFSQQVAQNFFFRHTGTSVETMSKILYTLGSDDYNIGHANQAMTRDTAAGVGDVSRVQHGEKYVTRPA